MSKETQTQINSVNAAISRIDRLYGKWAQSKGINSFAVGILYTLITESSITQKQYVDEFELPKQTVNNVIITLNNAGYITMTPSDKDRREKIINLTEEGQIYAEKLLAPLFRIEEAVTRRMGKKMMRDLINSTTAFGEFLEQEMAEYESKKGNII